MEKLCRGSASESMVVMEVTNDFAADAPEMVDVVANRFDREVLLTKVCNERQEQLDELLANGNVVSNTSPTLRPWPHHRGIVGR